MTPEISSSDSAAAPSTGAAVVSHLELWLQHWQEIKLRALECAFYYHMPWVVQAGDWYTITRHGPMLYRVASLDSGVVMEHHCNDSGRTDGLKSHVWDAEGFRDDGFMRNRVCIPAAVWSDVAAQHGLSLSQN